MKRIWKEIVAIGCRATQLALATCKDASTLDKLAIAFPECFGEGKETVLYVWNEFFAEILTKRFDAGSAANDFSEDDRKIPLLCWRRWDDSQSYPGLRKYGSHGWGDMGVLPDALRDVLRTIDIDKHEGGPVCITFDDVEWIIADVWVDCWDLGPSSLQVLCERNEEDREYGLELVPKALFACGI